MQLHNSNRMHYDGTRSVVVKGLEPSLKIHRWLGIVPMRLNHIDNSRLNADRKLLEKVQLVFSVLIVFLELCGYVYKLLHRFLVNPPLPFFNSLLYNLELLLGMMNTLFAIGGCQWKRHLYQHVRHRFEKLLIGCTPTEFDRVSGWFQRLTIVAVLAMLVTVVVDFLSWQNVTMSLASIFAVHIPTLITMLVIVQYWYAMSFILQHCRRINGVLATLPVERPQYDHIQIERLEGLRMQYKDLHELVVYVNGGFGKFLLSTLMAIVVVLNVEFLELYQYSRRGSFSVSLSSHIMYAIIWIIVHCGLLFMIVHPSHWIEHERRRTGLILFELMGGNTSSMYSDAVCSFTRQILVLQEQRKACGIVSLDLTLITRLIGTICTNLVIMIKFASE